jgi:hypothetical protein
LRVLIFMARTLGDLYGIQLSLRVP